mmetsp:Transcript_23/g.31  ORF Transcript_23/g.31 Transcript_23/m.31 type:complete len:475 (-) Transcript_23:51-1475(-)
MLLWKSFRSPTLKLAGQRVYQNNVQSINRVIAYDKSASNNGLVINSSAFRPKNQFDSRVRAFSSESSKKQVNDKDGVTKQCAKALSWMSNEIVSGETQVAKDFAKRLSPAAQQEVNSIAGNRAAAATTVPEPSQKDLRLVALNQAIPFIGFGIMDNSILIIAGDAIDTTVGVALGISTLCAAAIGNIISDVAGVMLGTVIEDFCAHLGLPTPNISAAQRQLRSTRYASQFGCAVGIVIGCIIGMFPLLFIDPNKNEKLKKEAHMDSLFEDVMEEAKGLVGADFTSLFMVVDSETSTTPSAMSDDLKDKFLYSKSFGKAIPLGHGIISRVAMTGDSFVAIDAQTHPDFDPEIWAPLCDLEVKGLACVPVFDAEQRVIAVIQAVNKIESSPSITKDEEEKINGELIFSHKDVQVLEALATHVSVSIQNFQEEENELKLKDTIKMIKNHGHLPKHMTEENMPCMGKPPRHVTHYQTP